MATLNGVLREVFGTIVSALSLAVLVVGVSFAWHLGKHLFEKMVQNYKELRQRHEN